MENNTPTPPIDLDECVASVDRFLQIPNLGISFLFRGYIRDFVAGAQVLSESEAGTEKYRRVARKLCEVSRELNFSAPSPMPEDLGNAISSLFEFVEQTIPPNVSDEVDSYRRNINFRVGEVTM